MQLPRLWSGAHCFEADRPNVRYGAKAVLDLRLVEPADSLFDQHHPPDRQSLTMKPREDRKPPRDIFDVLSFATAFAGVIVVVVSLVLSQQDGAESSRRRGRSIEVKTFRQPNAESRCRKTGSMSWHRHGLDVSQSERCLIRARGRIEGVPEGPLIGGEPRSLLALSRPASQRGNRIQPGAEPSAACRRRVRGSPPPPSALPPAFAGVGRRSHRRCDRQAIVDRSLARPLLCPPLRGGGRIQRAGGAEADSRTSFRRVRLATSASMVRWIMPFMSRMNPFGCRESEKRTREAAPTGSIS